MSIPSTTVLDDERETVILPHIPVEVIGEVFAAACDADEDVDIDEFLACRGNLRLVHSGLRHLIDSTPHFWRHVLVSPRVNFTELVNTYLERTSGLSFSLTIRVDDLAAFQELSVASQHPTSHDFIRSTIVAVLPFMLNCCSLDLQVANIVVAGNLLDGLRECPADALESFTIKFGLHNYYLFQPPQMATFAFHTPTRFGSPFPPISTLSVISSYDVHPSVTYFSGSESTLLLSQPDDSPFNWGQIMSMVTSSRSLTKLVLIGADFECSTEFMVSPPLPALQELHLVFEGNRSMAYLVSRLVLPELKTVKLTFIDVQDLECVSMCPHILSNVGEVIVIGNCSEDESLEDFFRLLPRVVSLDLRWAALEFFEAFYLASRQICLGASSNWYACPGLRRLAVGPILATALQELVTQRRLSGYADFDALCVGPMGAVWSDENILWFKECSIDLNLGTI